MGKRRKTDYSRLSINDWKILILFYNQKTPVTFCINDVVEKSNFTKIQVRYSLERLLKFGFLERFNSFIAFYTSIKDEQLKKEIRQNYLHLTKDLWGAFNE